MTASPKTAPPAPKLSAILQLSRQRKQVRQGVWLIWLLCLLAIVLSCSGCATTVPQPCEPLQAPLMPALHTPLPKVSYSATVQADLLMYQQRLTPTPAMSKP